MKNPQKWFASRIPNPYGRAQTLIQTLNVWFVHFLKTGLSETRIAYAHACRPLKNQGIRGIFVLSGLEF